MEGVPSRTKPPVTSGNAGRKKHVWYRSPGPRRASDSADPPGRPEAPDVQPPGRRRAAEPDVQRAGPPAHHDYASTAGELGASDRGEARATFVTAGHEVHLVVSASRSARKLSPGTPK